MGAKRNLTGETFGKLEVIQFEGRDQLGKSKWLCKCDCGNLTKVRGDCLTTGNTKTCGKCQVNHYNIIGEMAICSTSNGQTFIFDADEILSVKRYSWFISTNGYVTTSLNTGESLLLHSLILGEIDGLIIDHISRNKLDNRKCNLRYGTHQQNTFNSGVSRNNTTGYKGVYFDKSRNKFAAEITCSRKKYYIGRFQTAEEAAKAYNQKAIELFGEYAFLNPV